MISGLFVDKKRLLISSLLDETLPERFEASSVGDRRVAATLPAIVDDMVDGWFCSQAR